jgi:hypothetical protein
MTFKSDLTPLAETDLLDDEDYARLGDVGIRSVEELTDAIASSPGSISEVLKRSPDAVRTLLEQALALLDEPARKAFDEPRTKYATGALPPEREPSS